MAPEHGVVSWSFSNSMFRYLLVDHAVPAMWAQPCGGEGAGVGAFGPCGRGGQPARHASATRVSYAVGRASSSSGG